MSGFENPHAFFLLAAVPLYFVLRKFGFVFEPVFFIPLADWKGQAFEWKSPLASVFRYISKILFIAGYAALITALAEPVLLEQEKRFVSRGAEIIFVVDTSPSMAAMDIGGNSRLKAAKQAISLLVQENKGASYGLVACASQAALLVPPTLDQKTFFTRLEAMEPGELGDGSALGVGISTGVYHLVSSSAPAKIIVLLTDGENNAGPVHPNTAAALAKDKGIKLYAAGIGTKGSVPIEYTDPESGKVYSGYLDSDFNDFSLRSLAFAGGGNYYSVESLASLSAALQNISLKNAVQQSYVVKQKKESFYRHCTIFALICFCVAWILHRLYLKEL
ncbi:VWA domain-containing protein [Treponema sp. OMZ 840]|uniref:VWA domain-containing protein n=1 Tax=Treponema sp. OMZ 840 TaxID=244313 RepID=UPI003D93FA04